MPSRWALGLVTLVATGCTMVPDVGTPLPTPASPPPPREFTIATTRQIRTFDPAAITDDTSAIAAYGVFQRLLTVEPGQVSLRPDAASDCLFKAATVYECTLRPRLAFHNGNPLTSADVKFSILRALRLAVPGSSAVQLGALDQILTPDPQTVRFLLKWPDNQFGMALATPAASIVDSRIYDPDAVRAIGETASGSGPYSYQRQVEDRVRFVRYDAYQGAHTGFLPSIVLRYLPDSAAVEDSMRQGLVDAVWHGLADAAVVRLESQIAANKSGTTDSGFVQVPLQGVRVHLLAWSAGSPQRLDASLRTAVSAALQEDRTLTSIIPDGIEGHLAAFAAGGRPTPSPTPTPTARRARVRLTLSYAASAAGEKDLANVIRDRLESSAGVSVQLVADNPTADLQLLDHRAWTSSPFAWLQPYREAGVPGSAEKVLQLEQQARSATDTVARDILLGEIQKQAAADAVVLPVSQGDDSIFLGPGVSMNGTRFGPGWQLALWGLRK